MRLHITLDDDLVRELDRRVGRRRRSGFIAAAVRRALDDAQRWELVEAGLGSIDDEGHEWDLDLATWVHEGRRSAGSSPSPQQQV
jgi:hypothetical protein